MLVILVLVGMRCRDRLVESARDLTGMPLNLAGTNTPPLFYGCL
jgi:hypothetical protein